MNKQTEELREFFIRQFDIARREGMLKSRDGVHSRSSESDAENCLQACIDMNMVFLCSKEDKAFGVAKYIPIDLTEVEEVQQ